MIYNFIIKNIILNLLLVTIIFVLIIIEINNYLQNKNSLKIEEIIDLINHKNAIIIDFREKKLFDNLHIINSINIPENTNFIDKLKKYKNKIIIIVHNNNKSSIRIINAIKKEKLNETFYIKNGINEWIKNELPVKRNTQNDS